MTRRGSFDATLAHWLDDETAGMAPAGLHDDAMKAARAVRQRPMWLVAVRGGVDFGPRTLVAPRYVLVLLALALLVAALALVVGGGPRPIVNGRILLARETTGPKAEYLTVRPDGTDEVKFLEASECGQCTFWSPDGSRIMMPLVVEGRLRTAIIVPDRTGQFVLAFPGETLFLGPGDWSPDGRQIAFQGFDPSDLSRAGIYIAASDGSALRRVSTSTDGRTHDWPRFSPDGRRIVFLAVDADTAPAGRGFAGDLFMVTTEGGVPHQLNPPGTKVVATGTTGHMVDWSPDGRQLVFAAIEGPLADGRSSVFRVDADGGVPVRISDFGQWLVSVEWSPDGKWIAYGEVASGNESTWIAHPDGTGVRQLTGPGTSLVGCCATWSPVGTRLLFQRGTVGSRDLWTMDLTGNVLDQITRKPASYIWYSWAPRP
jgi:dipeptidyl aminopeptidase/acylaminoacyl peptidase